MNTRGLLWMLGLCACASTGNTSPDAALGSSDAPRGADAVASDASPDAAGSLLETCFPPTTPQPNYAQFAPTMHADCAGTNHQAIAGVERVVFLGDSITTGTPPTLPAQFYRHLLTEQLRAQFGPTIAVQDCSRWGGRTDDLLGPPHEQLRTCFPDAVDPRRTLVVMTVGGNDMSAFAKEAADGDTPQQTMAKVDVALQQLEEAVVWLKDPARFPSGVYVVFSNIYEFTDATGDLQSCPAAQLAGFSGAAAPQMEPAYLRAAEQYMRIAVEHQVDLVFSLESFCGHGFHSDDPASVCYRGPGTARWFDLTCIHPNPAGHAALANLFHLTITH